MQSTHEADIVGIGGFLTRYLSSPDPSGGSYALVEHTLPAGLLGAPPHRHSREDECSYVLEGTLTVWRAGTANAFPPGSVVTKLRGEWHTFWNAGTEPVRFLEIIAPGGFAAYFRELAPVIESALAANRAPDPAQIIALAARYGMEFDFDGMGRLLVEHRLRLG